MVNDWGKLALLGLVILCGTVLLIAQAVTPEAGVALITTSLGYLAGNGRLIARGESPVPALGRARDQLHSEAPPAEPEPAPASDWPQDWPR